MSHLLTQSLKIAHKAHLGQFRKKTGLPYIIHPLEVAKKLLTWGIDNETMTAAAILHDAVEDAGDNQTKVAREISDLGGDIYSIVNDLTLYKNQKKEDYLLTFKDKCVRSLIIKMADRVCNLNDFLLGKDTYFAKYIQKTRVLLDIYEDRVDEVKKNFGEQAVFNIDNDIFDLLEQYNLSEDK